MAGFERIFTGIKVMPKYLCNLKKYIKSIHFDDDRKQAEDEFENYGALIQTTAHTAKTSSQHGAFWRDCTIAAKLLHLTKAEIYFTLQTAEEFNDLFYLPENINKRTGEVVPRFRGMSELSKQEMTDFIPRYREFLQSWIDQEHGELVQVDWSRNEEKERAYWQSYQR